jgi:hypothetical protein
MTNKEDLKEKIEEKREESPYKRSLCDRAFSDRSEYESHQNSVHAEEQSI